RRVRRRGGAPARARRRGHGLGARLGLPGAGRGARRRRRVAGRARPLSLPGGGEVRARAARRAGARGRASAAAPLERQREAGARRVARIVVAGAGAMGASIAFQLASLGARDVVLADRRGIAAGATSKAMGAVRQQFSTAAEVRLAQASIRFFEELGSPLFEQVGYLFVATTETGLAELEERRELQAELGVPAERVDPSFVGGLRTDDVLGAVNCATDGVRDPPAV